MKKSTTVRVAVGSRSKILDVDHASRLLAMPNNGGWEIDDPNYTFDTSAGITRKKEATDDTKRKRTSRKNQSTSTGS